MRKIRFRGKSYTDNQWHYGFYSYQSANAFSEERHEIIEFSGLGYNCPAETIGQHTGLNDTDGVPIYEGDIIKVIIHKQGTGSEVTLANSAVYYEGSSFRVLQDEHPGSWVRLDSFAPYVEIEIIGNVHDKPELLEDDK